MNLQDFSNGFTTQLNSYSAPAGFGEASNRGSIVLNDHEKSLFLTRSQKEIVLELYNGRNSSLQGFEETEELRRYLSNLIEEAKLSLIVTSDGKPLGLESNSKFFTLPDDLWLITYESVLLNDGACENHTTQEVRPITQDEYHRIKKNPFRGANFRRALRLDLSENNVEIISKYSVSEYYVRYLRKLKPIILCKLDPEAAIEGRTEPQDCELHESLHQRILDRAVLIALQSKGYNSNNNTENR